MNTQQLPLARSVTAIMNAKQLRYTVLPTLQVTKNQASKNSKFKIACHKKKETVTKKSKICEVNDHFKITEFNIIQVVTSSA
jgi:hypothetical protein